MATITRAVLYGKEDLRLETEEVEFGPLADDEVLIETLITGMSPGTETANLDGRSTEVPTAPDYPRSLGYNNVGRVMEVGSAVKGLHAGQRVFTAGPHQSHSRISGDQRGAVLPIPDSVSTRQAALLHQPSFGLMGLRDVGFVPGENVAVIGLGIIGLAAAAVARACGARRVIAVGNSDLRNEKALALGAHAALMYDDPKLAEKIGEHVGPAGVDVVVNTANPWNAYKTALQIVRKRGRVAVVGFPGRNQPLPDFNPLDPYLYFAKGVTMVPTLPHVIGPYEPEVCRFPKVADLEFLLQLMADGRIDLESLITHSLPYEGIVEAYNHAATRDKSMIGTVFVWREQ